MRAFIVLLTVLCAATPVVATVADHREIEGPFADGPAVTAVCLGCHEYRKYPTDAGHPAYERKEFAGTVHEPPDLLEIARNVGPPDRSNCGSCHFFGGGGNAVKHGDLDDSLREPSRELDVHMGVDGADMSCQDCHKTDRHRISGNTLVVSPGGGTHIDCVDCHEGNPHTANAKTIAEHLEKVACQGCHIPSFAKGAPTKVWWDWSDAGRDLAVERDEFGMATFDKKKGSFTWDMNITPTYAWYDGSAGAHFLGDRMDPTSVTRLNWPRGSRGDPQAKIYPFKLMRGRQPYDVENLVFITPKLFGETGYWKTFDWDSAARQGMALTGLDYSGRYDFAETEMYWKINHMVAPKERSLKCLDCHGKKPRLDWEALGYDGDPMKTPKK